MRSKSCQLPFVTSVQLVEAGTASFTRTFSWKEVLGTRNRSDPDSTSISRRILNIHFICHHDKKQTIAYWARLLITYFSEIISLNSHTSLRSHVKNSCFVLHQGFQTPRNNKSTRPAASCLHLFLVSGTPDETLALVFDILHQMELFNGFLSDFVIHGPTHVQQSWFKDVCIIISWD